MATPTAIAPIISDSGFRRRSSAQAAMAAPPTGSRFTHTLSMAKRPHRATSPPMSAANRAIAGSVAIAVRTTMRPMDASWAATPVNVS